MNMVYWTLKLRVVTLHEGMVGKMMSLCKKD